MNNIGYLPILLISLFFLQVLPISIFYFTKYFQQHEQWYTLVCCMHTSMQYMTFLDMRYKA